jgi:hypothetical protein
MEKGGDLSITDRRCRSETPNGKGGGPSITDRRSGLRPLMEKGTAHQSHTDAGGLMEKGAACQSQTDASG